MNEIERCRDLDDEVFEEFKEYFPKTVVSDFKKEFPTTCLLVNMFDSSSAFIKNSIFDSCESDDYYGAKVLFRSLIEHFIRFKYLFVNWGLSKSDDFAKNYLDYGNAREVLDLIRAKVSEQQLHDPEFRIKDWDVFLKDHPNFKNKTRKEVDAETKKYTFKNIIRFLNEEFNKSDNEMSSFLGQLIIEYSDLSSYVHGGMKSYQTMMTNNSDKKREEEYNRISGLTFQMSNSIKLFSVLMYVQTDREAFSKHYFKIDKLLKQVNSQ
ncbi:hypothetical protein DWB61_17470 [Ancylomarina euxinus]|uniref:Uncharacterized protein n=1 Tax=Ancylomarina euxinus TaxID=2283627 RepID=A0A425XWD6_9BACT|nr:DUF5677 domain-containing protein [Ancylomarina euxinus]MCZ4696452.1 DUF5677 domain-containing protein [Ancylomarina euxinus]MUP16815.1 hypothetical protein [Ancylomarina euxinus]RRG18961.1 hypothetical protein DWB61_17470 [Ancylomarina euxinus]